MPTQRQKDIAKAVTRYIPQAPFYDAEAIRAQACAKHMRELKPDAAVWLSIIAYIRHNYTPYDSLRDEGYERDAARFFIAEAVNAKLRKWRATRFLSYEENTEEKEMPC